MPVAPPPDPKKPWYRKTWVIVTGIVVLGLIIVGALAPSDEDEPNAVAATDSTVTTSPPATTSASTTTTPDRADLEAHAAWLSALETLEVVVALEAPVPYDRVDYQGDGWSDFDADCLSTRHEVLVVESTAAPVLSEDGCFVETGVWFDPWSDQRLTAAKEATIDHMIPLAHAHRAGAWAWDADTKSRFTNDENPAALNVVSQSTNSSKGMSAPDEWKPPLETAWCQYAQDWIRTKIRWQLAVTADEKEALEEMLDSCLELDTEGPAIRSTPPNAGALIVMATTTIPPTSPPPTTAPPTTTAPPPPLVPQTAPPPIEPAPPPPPAPGCEPGYSPCIPPGPDVDCAGGSGNGPRYVSGPVRVTGADSYGLDRDGDGIGCEDG